jgi:DNA-binding CsgD family transcriptional regulator
VTPSVNGSTSLDPLDPHAPLPGAAPGGTAPHEAGTAAAGSIRVLVVGAPGPPVQTLLALLGRTLSVEAVGAPTDIAVVDLPEDGAPGPGAAAGCACTAGVRATRGPRPPGRVLERPDRVPRPRPAGGGGAPSRAAECSPREREVLAVVAEGASNPEIAARLSISEATVRSHVQSLRGKLGARSRAELVVRAFEMGLGPFACAH